MGNPKIKPLRLLLADNQKDGLKKMETLLKRRYEKVDLCEDLASVKECFVAGKYDIAIVALEMDWNEGYQSVEYIYAQDPGQRIITYSAEPEQPSHGEGCAVCLEENRRHRIRKPILLKELYEEIEQFDEKKCSFAETAIKMYEGYREK
jgi:DNA-binding NtrC family response regulator